MPRLSFEIREDTQRVLTRLAERYCRGVRDEARFIFERAVEHAARSSPSLDRRDEPTQAVA
jgi:hypothetical protein